MNYEDRRILLDTVFSGVDEGQVELVHHLLDEVVFLEERMDELKKMPFIAVHPSNAMRQKVTPAAKLYKECSQSYMNAIRILLSLLKQQEIDEQNELLKRLDEFMTT